LFLTKDTQQCTWQIPYRLNIMTVHFSYCRYTVVMMGTWFQKWWELNAFSQGTKLKYISHVHVSTIV